MIIRIELPIQCIEFLHGMCRITLKISYRFGWKSICKDALSILAIKALIHSMIDHQCVCYIEKRVTEWKRQNGRKSKQKERKSRQKKQLIYICRNACIKFKLNRPMIRYNQSAILVPHVANSK